MISIIWSRDYRSADLLVEGTSIGHLVMMPSSRWALFGSKAFAFYPTPDAAIDRAKKKIRESLDGSNLQAHLK